MKRCIVAMAVIICMITGFLYLQYGRDVKVTSSKNFSSGNYYEMELTLVANKLFIIDKQRFAEEMIERCIDNNFYDIKFSYDMIGYPDYVTIKIFPNDLCRILHKGDYSVIYKAEYGANNKKDNVYNKIPSYGILYFKTIDMEIIRSFDMYAGKQKEEKLFVDKSSAGVIIY